ncbi:MAG: hypothetical protein K2W94_04680 [Alphaproteobacteria bacterium]|nr:hypothetical protein [Alphaproteobacteria bacterium]
MRSLFCVIFFLVLFEKGHASAPLKSELTELTVEKLSTILPPLQHSWDSSSLTKKKQPDDEDHLSVSCLYSTKKGIPLNSTAYKYVYVEVTFKEDVYSDSIFKRRRYSKSTTFQSFLDGHSVAKLTPDCSQDFRLLSMLSSKLSAEEMSGLSREILPFFQYFAEKEESYTIAFIR